MNTKYIRKLRLLLNSEVSVFLLGPRQVGKSTFLKANYPQSIYIDLLDSSTYMRYLKEPSLIRSEIKSRIQDDPELKRQPIIIDEIQKLPILLNEVHKLIEDESLQFILSGSSARKLVRKGSNMLGGRAIRKEMFPLVSTEIPNFDLLRALNNGLIPSHYNSEISDDLHDAYIDLYLKEEIQQEGLVRSLRPFSLFLESVAFSNCEIVNYSNIARELHVDSKTVTEYYQILADTLLGYFVYPYKARNKRSDISSAPKFYLFDVGLAQKLRGTKLTKTKGIEFGHAFEQFIFLEIYAYLHYANKKKDLTYWRGKGGYEVDFILGDAEIAIEIKSSKNVQNRDLNGLIAFKEAHSPKNSFVISMVDESRLLDNGIEIVNYSRFLEKLWAGEVI